MHSIKFLIIVSAVKLAFAPPLTFAATATVAIPVSARVLSNCQTLIQPLRTIKNETKEPNILASLTLTCSLLTPFSIEVNSDACIISDGRRSNSQLSKKAPRCVNDFPIKQVLGIKRISGIGFGSAQIFSIYTEAQQVSQTDPVEDIIITITY